MTRILIVEDHEDIATGLQDHLEHAGFEARATGSGLEGVQLAAAWRPHLVILDLMLGDISGHDVLLRLRASGDAVPVLILSAKNDEMAKVRGFREGADDYVTKPFGIHELVERVRALLRRATPREGARRESAPTRIVVGELVVEPAARRVTRDGREVALRPKEYDLLIALLQRPDEVVSRQELLRHAWAYEPGVESRTVDWHVAELRRKLGDDADAPRLIVTVRKVGYRWCAVPTG
jgi:two-component system response regulator MtrA